MAISQSDGSIVLSTEIDEGGLKRGLSVLIKNQRTQLQKLRKEYSQLLITNQQNTEQGRKLREQISNVSEALKESEDAVKDFGDEAKKSGNTSQSAFKKIGASIQQFAIVLAAIAIKKTTDFAREASNAAIQTEASVYRLIDIYGEASKAVGNFIDENARALGMSKSAAASFSSVYGNLFSVWADQATNAKLTNAYLNITAVIASKTGRTVEDVQERIRSGLLGNTEAIEDLGVFVNVKTIEMTDAFKKMANGRSWEQLNAYEQQQVRTLAILEQSTQKYGSQVAQTAAFAQSNLKAAIGDFSNSLGQVLNVVLVPMLQVVTELFNYAYEGLNALTGKSGGILENAEVFADNAESAAQSQAELNENLKETDKQLKKTTAGFDEISTLGAQISSDTQEGEAVDLSSYDFGEQSQEIIDSENEVSQWAKKIWELLTPVYNSLSKIFSVFVKLSPVIEGVGNIFGTTIEDAQETLDYLADKIDEYDEEIQYIANVINWLWEKIAQPTLKQIAASIGQVTNIVTDSIFSIIGWIGSLIGVFENLFKAIGAAFKGDLNGALEYATKAFEGAINMWVNLINFFIDGINSAWLWIYTSTSQYWSPLLQTIQDIGNALGTDWNFADQISFPQIPQIGRFEMEVPALARGAVLPANQPFLALLGDQKSGTNIEAPLQTIVDAFNIALQNNANYGGGTTEVVLEIDGREFGRAVVEQGNRENRRIGTRMVIV